MSPLGWVLSVPDTHQRSVIKLLEIDAEIRLVTCSTEDEANAIAAGLYMGGEPVMLLIQHAGLFASVNTLRGVAMDGRVPTFYLVGLLGRKPGEELAESRSSMVRYAEPLLDTFAVPYARLENADDVPRIVEYYRLSREQRGPAVVLVGLETAE
jgi:sulfopyruvate decarboxylase TPP-binding subunit